ncbi:MAG: nuclear transport factor 2 family protein [Hyphomonadaceae bacterium]
MQETADRLEIIDRLGRYSLAVDFKAFADLREVFTEDADIQYDLRALGGELVTCAGLADVIAWLERFIQAPPAPLRSLTNFVIEVAGDAARSRNYLHAGPRAMGTFTAQWKRTPAGWRIAHFRMQAFAPPA